MTVMTSVPVRPDPSRGAPWDILLVSSLVLATCFLDSIDMLGLLLSGIPASVRAGDLEQLAAMLISIGRYAATAIAALQLRALRPWARLWLALLAFVSVVFWRSGFDEIAEQLRALPRGGMEAFVAAQWLAHHVFPIVTLAVLGRPREDFPPLAPRARWIVIAGVVLLMMFGRFQRWWHARPGVEPPRSSRVAHDDATARPQPALAPGEATLTIRPTFRGRPLDGMARERVSLTLDRSEVTKVQNGPHGTAASYDPVGPLDRPWTVHDGLIEVPRVPAALYEVKVTITGDAARGDLVGSAGYLFHAANGPASVDVTLIEAIRLSAPQQGAPVSSPLTVAWQPVAGADRYIAHLFPSEGDGAAGRDIIATVTEARWVVDVPPGEWTLSLDANMGEDHETIAVLFEEPKFVVRTPFLP